ncbi:tetratricopeptide repeat protein [Stigmatella sp. ncwal1]|uniref:Tetratricopeptide repeat protein n=1 Tax=Stigmatella ashevillensis TaxID=2995309 RepID=A0ABT5D3U0_9BACT|nr:tetratricopeptide repeat protein [Stigmatella ashevillena]MDC0707750.1 tetratricopeptide repeat protein [Stigmatella ashevillena]
MRQFFDCLLAVFLCWAFAGHASEAPLDARLAEAQSHFDEASRLRAAGQYSNALPRIERALALREAVLGESHPDVASCLILMGDIHWQQGDLVTTEPLFLRALAIREAAFGKSHPEVAQPLNGLASIYIDQGLYDQAEPLCLRAIAIQEAAPNDKHPGFALSLNNLAKLYHEQGLYGQAEPFYLRALAILDAPLGKSHPHVVLPLTNLATLYTHQGAYSRAEPLLLRALSIQEATLGNNHPSLVITLINLGNLYSNQGLYDRAEPLFLRSHSLAETALGKNHTSVATALNNLAVIYQDQGLYDRAVLSLQRALAIWEASLGSQHPVVATALSNLAVLYSNQGLYDQAEALLQRVLSLSETAFDKHHPLIAESLHNLANLYSLQGLYAQAEPLHRRALALREASLGHSHPLVAASLHSLAVLYQSRGLYGRAAPLHQRSIALREAAFGHAHPDVALSLNHLAQLRLAQHRLSDALPLLSRSFSMSERRLRREALDFSESRLSSFLSHLRSDEQRLYSLLRDHPRDARVQRLALSAALLLKGRSVSETAHISRTLLLSLSAEDRDSFERLRSLRTQLASLSFSGPGDLSPEAYQQRLQSFALEGDSLETELAKRSAPLRALSSLPSPDDIVHRVASSLPKDSALVEFIAYKDSPLLPSPDTASRMRYLALVLFPNSSIRSVDLGPSSPIDLAASRLRDALADQDASFQSSSQELYRRAFLPLLPLLGSTRRLFLSPDSQLNLVPFSALHDGHAFLLDSFDFSYLTSGRELLPRPQDLIPSSSIFVLADPDFAAPSPAPPPGAPPSPTRSPLPNSLQRFFSTPHLDVLREAWVSLPGTRLEAQAIQRLLPQAQLFLGSDASKERLLDLPTPGILHLATHGFFLGNSPSSPDSRGLAFVDSLGGPPAPQQEPLLNSGLVLSGALSSAPDASSLRSEASLVTALELAGLNLWGTQLVVLSACDTGRGEIHLGQGVFGLRRALVAAGAETVLVSLWKVNDDSTRLLMDLYYRNLLNGLGRASALREAMRVFWTTHPHPHDWAPFIALGSDAPLRAISPALPPKPKALTVRRHSSSTTCVER